MFRHFDEEIIIEYYECIDYKQKVDVLCLDRWQYFMLAIFHVKRVSRIRIKIVLSLL